MAQDLISNSITVTSGGRSCLFRLRCAVADARPILNMAANLLCRDVLKFILCTLAVVDTEQIFEQFCSLFSSQTPSQPPVRLPSSWIDLLEELASFPR